MHLNSAISIKTMEVTIMLLGEGWQWGEHIKPPIRDEVQVVLE
jgi:hypothetical protein